MRPIRIAWVEKQKLEKRNSLVVQLGINKSAARGDFLPVRWREPSFRKKPTGKEV